MELSGSVVCFAREVNLGLLMLIQYASYFFPSFASIDLYCVGEKI